MALISQAEEQSTVNQWHSKARAGTSSWKYMYMTREVVLMEKFYLYQVKLELECSWRKTK